MKKTNKIIIAVILIAALLLGIGYAAIQNITLNINGTAKADPNQSNFSVKFTKPLTESDEEKVKAAITDDLNATINVTGLTQKGQEVYATYTIQNTSSDLSADLSIEATNSNKEYFTISTELEKASLTAGEATTLKVTVKLIKTPITDTENTTIGVQITAAPVQPGEEGTTTPTNPTPTPEPEIVTLAEVTNDNIGDYIDLGNSYVNTEATTDDWRILYVENDTIYAILADYLPASQVPEAAGLTTNTAEYPYSVWSDKDRDTLLNGLTNTTAWASLANGISGATVTGATTGEMIIKSYNEKNGTSLTFDSSTQTAGFYLNGTSTEDNDLYVPHTAEYESCYGYWLDSPYASNAYSVWYVYYSGYVNTSRYNYFDVGVRPVVSLPSSINATVDGNVWTIVK